MYVIRVTDGWHNSIIGPFKTPDEAREFQKEQIAQPFVAVLHPLESPDVWVEVNADLPTVS